MKKKNLVVALEIMDAKGKSGNNGTVFVVDGSNWHKLRQLIADCLNEPVPNPNYMTASEAASLLNLSEVVFRNLSNRGDISGRTVRGSKVLWQRSAIEETAKQLEIL